MHRPPGLQPISSPYRPSGDTLRLPCGLADLLPRTPPPPPPRPRRLSKDAPREEGEKGTDPALIQEPTQPDRTRLGRGKGGRGAQAPSEGRPVIELGASAGPSVRGTPTIPPPPASQIDDRSSRPLRAKARAPAGPLQASSLPSLYSSLRTPPYPVHAAFCNPTASSIREDCFSRLQDQPWPAPGAPFPDPARATFTRQAARVRALPSVHARPFSPVESALRPAPVRTLATRTPDAQRPLRAQQTPSPSPTSSLLASDHNTVLTLA